MQTLTNGLQALDQVLHDFDTSDAFKNLHGVAQGTGTLLPLGSTNGQDGLLGDTFRDQFAAAFSGATTVGDINAFLNAGPAAGSTGSFTGVTWSGIKGGNYGGDKPFEWELTVKAQKAGPVEAQLEGGPTFGTAPSLDVTGSGTVTFSFGLAADGSFFPR